ncbi:hypothetical protein [Caballeronia sp. SBC2]|uniref:hypothetical protein n=1 Tax=Caballeronia sp. SBC2 TaxID=2705547 RepID=UPI0013E172A3|nr:hypothetical protein [Caballeronia sp. SBC2]QIE22948.1 hypothetical protein SBC2_09610 [Caballeronia sp. SBC2]
MSGRVFVVSHPWLAGYLKIIAFGGTPSPTDAALNDAAEPRGPVLFHIIVGRPGEVSRRAWYELRHYPGTTGWLQCPASLAISTLQRIATQALEEEKCAARVRARWIAKPDGPESHPHSHVVVRYFNGLEVSSKISLEARANGAGQALAIRGQYEREVCSACRSEVRPGATHCAGCEATLIRF